MSPASKSKSKDKSTSKAAKEQQKSFSKPSVIPANGGNVITTSAYNPLSGTFHSLEAGASAAMPTPQSNGRFHNKDETEEHPGTSLGTSAEYDSVSNNDSCSGESEDQQKERTVPSSSRTEPIPGSDVEKREKIRLKNEKKHQRQRERRAQELHERCCSFLISSKLESQAQKLVAMGFVVEQATMALIHNEGRVEESAIWLLEKGEESKHQGPSNLDAANSKIDITDELARMADMELNFKCMKQEVERIVVACEGDLDKAEETLKAQKQERAVTPKSDQSGDYNQPTTSSNGFHNSSSRIVTSISQNSLPRTQTKGASPPASVQLQRREERDFNYTKLTAAHVEAVNRNLQPSLKKKPQAVVPSVEKRWPSTSSNSTQQYSLASPLHAGAAVAQAKPETRYVPTGAGETKANLLSGTLREPIFVMQRPQSSGGRQNVTAASVNLSASPPATNGWYNHSNGSAALDMMKLTNGNGGLGQQLRNMTLSASNSHQLYAQSLHQQFISASSPAESGGGGGGGLGWSGSYSSMPGATTRSPSSSSLAVPSSLGLFTIWGSSGSSGSSSPVDWSTHGSSMPQCDYTSIDWSLDSTPLTMPPSSIKAERLYDNSWLSSYTTSKAAAAATAMRQVNGGGVLQDGSLMVDHPVAPSAGAHEWTSPFAGKDLFRVPRQYVTSPLP